MVRIKMLRNKHGSPDGHSVLHYEQGKEYDVPESLAKVFVEDDKVAALAGQVDPEEAARVAAEKAEKERKAAEAKAAKEAEKAAKAEAAAKAKAEKERQKALKSAPQNKAENVQENK